MSKINSPESLGRKARQGCIGTSILIGAILLCAVVTAHNSTMQALLAPLPTDTPVPPTPKPTPVLSVKQKIENAVLNDSGAVAFCYIVDPKTSLVEVDGQAVTITEDASKAPITSTDRAKECIFYVEKAAWTSRVPVDSVTVHFEATLQDQYGRQSVGDLARATLNKGTAQKFVWDNLDYNSAWAVYDTTYLLPG